MPRVKRSIAVIDAETDPFLRLRVPEPFVWGFYDGERFRTFTDARELVEFLKPQPLIVYAHNGGKFDYHFLLQFLDTFTNCLIINGRLAQFNIGLCEFRDSWNILPEKLEKFVIDGRKKLKIDYAWFEKKVRHKHMPTILRYLREDCVVLYETVSRFIETYGPNLTLASSAMKFWQNLSGLEKPNSSEENYERHSKYYYGGRVQCFDSGIINRPGACFQVADINSAYPHAMLYDHPFSTHSAGVECRITDPVVPQSFYDIECIARGCFPLVQGDSLTFPNDGEKHVYHITGWELQAAIDTGSIREGRILARRDFAVSVEFKKYVHHFYEMRKKVGKKTAEGIFCKLMMNSLYGRFAMDPREYENFAIVPNGAEDEIEADDEYRIGRFFGPWRRCGLIGPNALMKSELYGAQRDRGFCNVATSASITGFVRAKLHRTMHAVEKSGGKILYSDTDSVAYYPGSCDPIEYGADLGLWSSEGFFDRGGIAGKKLYAFHRPKPLPQVKGEHLTLEQRTWKTACKGARLTPRQIMQVAAGKVIEYVPEVPTFSVHSGPKFVNRTIRATA